MTPDQYKILFDDASCQEEEDQQLREAHGGATQRWSNAASSSRVLIPAPPGTDVLESAPIAQFRITPSEPEPEPEWLWKPAPPSFWKRLRLR